MMNEKLDKKVSPPFEGGEMYQAYIQNSVEKPHTPFRTTDFPVRNYKVLSDREYSCPMSLN
jgi:hypothetical protein